MTSHEVFTAQEVAKCLVSPAPLDHGLLSGLFVQVSSANEGSLFLRDLARELNTGGVRVFQAHGRDLILPDALASLVSLFIAPGISSDSRLQLASGETLAGVLAKTLPSQGTFAALLIDEAQALLGKSGQQILKGLKAARDAVNLDPNQCGRFVLVASCTAPAEVARFVSDRDNPFYGATAIAVRQEQGPTSHF